MASLLKWAGGVVGGVLLIAALWWYLGQPYPWVFVSIATLAAAGALGIALYVRLTQKQREEAFRQHFRIFKPIGKVNAGELVFTYRPEVPYRRRPADDKVREIVSQGKPVLIVGVPGTGKTHMAYDALSALRGYHLLVPTTNHLDLAQVDFGALKGKRVALLLDNAHELIDRFDPETLWQRIEKAPGQGSARLVITCRDSGKEWDTLSDKWGSLLATAERIEPERLSEEDKTAILDKLPADDRGERERRFDGTPGALIFGLPEMTRRYKGLSPEAKAVMKSLKLLHTAGIYGFTEQRVKALCRDIFELTEEALARYRWDELLTEIERQGLARVVTHGGSQRLETEDAYLEACVTDNPGPEAHLPQLLRTLERIKDAEGLFYLGNRHYFAGQLEEAGSAYQASLAIKPDLHEALYNWGNALQAQAVTKSGEQADRLFALAGEKYQQALQIKPALHEALSNWGNALSDQAKTKSGEQADILFALAGEKYQQALAIKPDYHEALYNWGNALSDQAKTKSDHEADTLYTQAYDKYDKALQIKPDKHEALYNWGTALSDQAKTKSGEQADSLFAQAYEKYDKALQIKPDDHEALIGGGIALAMLGRTVEAEEHFQQALRLNPDSALAHADYAVLLEGLGRSEEAMKHLQKARELGFSP